jgi:hypothetical protein
MLLAPCSPAVNAAHWAGSSLRFDLLYALCPMLSALCQFRHHLLCQRIRSHAVSIDQNTLQIIFFR